MGGVRACCGRDEPGIVTLELRIAELADQVAALELPFSGGSVVVGHGPVRR